MTSGARLLIAGYALAVAALCLVLGLQLLPILFAGLLVYSVVGALAPGLQRHVPGVYAHRLVVAVLAVLVVGVLTLAIVAAIAYLGSENGNPARFFERMSPLIERARTQLPRSEEHTSELQSRQYLVCRLLLEKKKQKN